MSRVKLVDRKNFSDIWDSGHYAWITSYVSKDFFEEIQALMLCCPGCMGITIASHRITISKKEPLTIQEAFTCPECRLTFSITDGEAIWDEKSRDASVAI